PEFRTKHLLKRAVSGLIPDEIIGRPKQGFAVPVAEWFQKELGSRIRTTLAAFNNEHSYFDPDELTRVLAPGNSVLPWYLFNFALWHQTWIEQKKPDAIPSLLPSPRG